MFLGIVIFEFFEKVGFYFFDVNIIDKKRCLIVFIREMRKWNFFNIRNFYSRKKKFEKVKFGGVGGGSN